MMDHTTANCSFLQDDLENFFEQSICGFLITDPQGIIIKSNARIAKWMGCSADELKGKRFSDLLTIGGKIYYQTHLTPLLRMQGFFDEIVLELNIANSQKLRVLVNAFENRSQADNPRSINYAILKASDRLQYEQNLQLAKANAEKDLLAQKEMVAMREQLIAVLGHDLRNPLSSVSMATQLLQLSTLSPEDVELVAMLKRSTSRMSELIKNIMDFARTRLGEGMILSLQKTTLTPVLQHIVEELKSIFPKTEIITSFNITEPLNCDPDRIGQLLSNLLANAITHGSKNTPVYVRASISNGIFELSVSNHGAPIPETLHEHLFAPFTREANRPSQNGLGLGLYISAQIAKAHNASLTCSSTAEETRFTFCMSV